MHSSLKLSVAANAGIKVLALIVSLLSTPLTMSFFSNDTVLGAWFTVLSVLNWISFFDFGIGNGLRNDLTYALNEGEGSSCNFLVDFRSRYSCTCFDSFRRSGICTRQLEFSLLSRYG